jgi:RNA-directed DNA polymerase
VIPPDDLWPTVLSLDNLAAAWDRVRANHGCAGADNVTVDQFHQHRERALRKLRAALGSRHYRPLHLRAFHIPKPDGGLRTLGVPAVRDRVAQQAVVQVIGPLLEATFEDTSFAYRPRRSILQAIRRVLRLRDAGLRHALDADIDGFFDHVDHGLLIDRLRALVPDSDIVRLVWQWLRSPALDGQELRERRLGLPQGAVISPLLANLYLDPLDEALAKAGYEAVRYADDFMVFCESAERAQTAYEFAVAELAKLRLRAEPTKTRLTTFDEGFTYLGAQFKGKECILPELGRAWYGAAGGRGSGKPPVAAVFEPPALRGWRNTWQPHLLPLSALCDWAFCPRKAYLHIACGIEEETADMIEGAAAHTAALPGNWRSAALHREVPVASQRLGLQGKLDLVEEKWGLLMLVEMKWSLRGESTEGALLQLAAGAMCLEETWGCEVPFGAVVALPSHIRFPVDLDADLRNRAERAATALRQALGADAPPPGNTDRCPACSLHPVCLWEETASLRDSLVAGIGQVDY